MSDSAYVRLERTRNLRWNSKQGVGSGTCDPSHPSIGGSVIAIPIFEVPIISGVRKIAKRVVRCDCVSSPTRNGDAKMLNVTGIGREVDTVNMWVDLAIILILDAN